MQAGSPEESFADALIGADASVVILEEEFQRSPLQRQALIFKRLREHNIPVVRGINGDAGVQRGRLNVKTVPGGLEFQWLID